MPNPTADVNRFFQLLTKRRFSEAERVFGQIRKGAQKNEWNRGYMQALNGMFLAKKSNDDRYMFLSNMNFVNKGGLQKHRRGFSKYARDKLYADYDRGFFSAWADYLLFLLK